MDVLCKRFYKFLCSCVNSSNDVVRHVARHGVFHSRMQSCIGRNLQFLRERYVSMGRSVMFDVGRCALWTKNEIDFARLWRFEVDRVMVDRADMIKELAMIRDGVLCWSEADFTPEDAQTLIVSLSTD